MKRSFFSFDFDMIMISLLLWSPITVSASPYMMVNSGRPKCITTEVPRNIYIRIHYDAPDIKFDKDDPSYGPTYITTMSRMKTTTHDVAAENHHHHNKARETLMRDRMGNVPTNSHEIDPKKTKSHIDLKVPFDSEVNICIRASMAGKLNPMRFHLRVEELGDEADKKAEDEEEELLRNADVNSHLSFMEVQMIRIEGQMHAMISQADLSKERDAIYHKRTDAMHQATIFWPVVHIGIIFLTSLAQVNHIVKFFKSRRII